MCRELKKGWEPEVYIVFQLGTYHDNGIMYSNGTVAPSTKEYKNVTFTTKELKVESIPERNKEAYYKKKFNFFCIFPLP